MKKITCFYLLICSVFLCTAQKSLSEYVNPFIGTGGHGHTFPGATTPFGMVQLSPDTRIDGSWDGCSGYHYSDTVLYGFSHTHLSGTGCSDYGDILLMPFVWKKEGEIPSSFTSRFSHVAEMASPGYYGVRPENGILTELTASTRAGFHRYDYGAYQENGEPQTVSDPENTLSAGVVLDLYHRDDLLDFEIISVGKNEVYGYRRSKAWAKNQIVYYWITFSEPFERYFTLDKNNHTARSGAKMAFDFGKKDNIKVKVGISGVNAKGANKNLTKEIPHWDFEKTRDEAVAGWDKELSKIQVEASSVEQYTVFYTALYHCMIAPNIYSDVDGQYRGRDDKIHSTGGDWDYYTVFSLWDTYRALHPLLTIIDEKRTNHFIRTFIRQYEEGGLLPVWELSANETYCMIGYHSVSVIADAYMKGIRDYDAEKAFAAMKHSAMQDHFGLAAYKKYGYIPSDKEHESVSKTLEYAYDDWCIAQMAKEMGKKEDYEYFLKRSQGYLNLYNKETGFFRPRKNGGWLSPFRPSEVNNHYTEGNAYHYSFGNQHDLSSFYSLWRPYKNQVEIKLDSLFLTKQKMTGREQADVTGLIGQYAHGNEPSHHIPYVYSVFGSPEKTQERVHRVMTEFYNDQPDGLIGNEDCGQMSAWYVLSALGFYPVTPGGNTYQTGTPLFSKARVALANNKTLTILAENLSEENYYVKSISFGSEKSYPMTLFHATQKLKNQSITGIKEGGELRFEMTDKPVSVKQWGASTQKKPSFLLISGDKKTFRDSLKISITDGFGESTEGLYYTIDGSNPS
ncbi:MAG: GH92 family glycosyl hydrolase, partial [Bacteroidia bacterium]|nr:GH92 family glycosyl hydrolase [Bacteroidia bacterium]